MKLRYWFGEAIRFAKFAFYPKKTLLFCLLAVLVTNLAAWLYLGRVQDDASRGIALSLATGATASFFVAIVIELPSNYKRNMLAWHELRHYYMAVSDYEIRKQVFMRGVASKSAERQTSVDFKVSGKGVSERGLRSEAEDLVAVTWKLLPDIMPVLAKTYESKKAFLSKLEIEELESICSSYRLVKKEVKCILGYPLLYNMLNHPDEQTIKGELPENIVDDIPEWLVRGFARKEEEAALDRLVDVVMSDAFLLERLMDGYEIAQKTIEEYDSDAASDESSCLFGELELFLFENFPPEEEMSEEEFKASRAAVAQTVEAAWKESVSYLISSSCKSIAESIDVLEKHITDKPYIGLMLKLTRKTSEA